MLTLQPLKPSDICACAEFVYTTLGGKSTFDSVDDIKYGFLYKKSYFMASEIKLLEELDRFLRIVELEALSPVYYLRNGTEPSIYFVTKSREFDPLSVIFVSKL